VPLAFGASAVVLAHQSLTRELILAAVGQLAFWATILRCFGSDVRFYPYRPNPSVVAYDDLRSRHWLVAERTAPGTSPELSDPLRPKSLAG
jgi:hypothetical protein